uniref:Uncharacterized protein n=1 Tax=Anguilla anguilla TaxID=7936 RepID=A0A0E9TQA3_ANGAN
MLLMFIIIIIIIIHNNNILYIATYIKMDESRSTF